MECEALANGVSGLANQYMSMVLNFMALSQCSISSPDQWPSDYGNVVLRRGFMEEYDFIIVGAGSAGSVLANRLSENPDWKILLLEAGGDPSIESAIPQMSEKLMKTPLDWQYIIENSRNYTAINGYWPRGKALGGSSSINRMYYVRGNEGDYNNWEKLGNPTWGWKDVLPYFRKSEANANPEIANAHEGHFHSKDGPMSVELTPIWDKLDILRAAKELGYKYIRDINANEYIGYNTPQKTIRSGVRESTATAFLRPIRNRSNLHVVKYAHVLGLEFNEEDGSVYGVRMNLRGKRELRAFAKKEVILSAGVINSPQILMLSGIGPADHLDKMEIPVIQDLKVGKNLQDHPFVILTMKYNESSKIPSPDLTNEYLQYLTNRTGFFLGPTRIIGYVNAQDPSAKYPDFQYFHMDFRKGETNAISNALKGLDFKSNIVDFFTERVKESDILIAYLAFLAEDSKGEVLLRSTNPFDKPRIIPNYLSKNSDIDAFIRAIRLYTKFLTTETFKEKQVELLPIPIHGCDGFTFNSDDYWACYCRYMVGTMFHPIGTAKMGPDTDPDAVVDYRLRVKGVKGLRVIDASIMPRIPSGNTNAPTIMVAEKGADFIIEDWTVASSAGNTTQDIDEEHSKKIQIEENSRGSRKYGHKDGKTRTIWGKISNYASKLSHKIINGFKKTENSTN
ncbi:glucose dehydrogenase [FAD, quinone]-like [Lutzomyia longipalpis]|uniref:glucose dehydrogenase [FAD, quinone]-like n=1 Tax=Lutzomyia longipalpis TaxID=7200 RepID=UPI0024846F19|nr:glucose dehydrogenase [FAD, quinone]-like [Lutzomyia longipalpis]